MWPPESSVRCRNRSTDDGGPPMRRARAPARPASFPRRPPHRASSSGLASPRRTAPRHESTDRTRAVHAEPREPRARESGAKDNGPIRSARHGQNETKMMIGRLLGHSQIETTARYAHLARDSVHEAADRIADSLAKDLFADARRSRTTKWSGNSVSLTPDTHGDVA